MGSLSNYAENELVDHLFNAAYSPVAAIYLALSTADPTDTGTGASMSETANTNGYARTAITFGAAALRKVTQSADVTFPAVTGANWSTAITHWAIVDSATHGAGNVLAHGAFTSPFTPVVGNQPVIPSGEVVVEIQATASNGGFTDYAVHSLLNLMFRNIAFGKPDTYLALSTTVLNDQDVAVGDFTEVTGTAYARKQVNPNGGAAPTWTVASGGALSNADAIIFGTAGVVGAGGWTQVVAVAVISSASGAGNVLAYDSANVVDQTPAANDIVRFPAGDFDVALS
jgi:hypothetical protein